MVVRWRKQDGANLNGAVAWKEGDTAHTAFSNPIYSNPVDERLNTADADSLYGYSSERIGGVGLGTNDGGYAELQDGPDGDTSGYMRVAGAERRDSEEGDGGYISVSLAREEDSGTGYLSPSGPVNGNVSRL